MSVEPHNNTSSPFDAAAPQTAAAAATAAQYRECLSNRWRIIIVSNYQQIPTYLWPRQWKRYQNRGGVFADVSIFLLIEAITGEKKFCDRCVCAL